MKKAYILFPSICLVIFIACSHHNRTNHEALIRGYVSGCFDTYIDIYTGLGVKQPNREEVIKFCEEKHQMKYEENK